MELHLYDTQVSELDSLLTDRTVEALHQGLDRLLHDLGRAYAEVDAAVKRERE
jgi:hypothetical protein